jgi:2'-5' RNA ligase
MSLLYFLAVVLPDALNAEIKGFKTHMLQEYGCKVALKSPAHITVIPPYWMELELEASLLQDVQALAAPFAPFPLKLQHFSAFKPRTLFVAVQPSEQLYRLKMAADDFFTRHTPYKAKPDSHSFHPHVTIATRDLHKKTFAEAWQFYETKHYERSFTATGLSVLRHNQKQWDIIATALFGA